MNPPPLVDEIANRLRHPVAPGQTESAAPPEPVFTPAIKAEAGHGKNISFEEARKV